MLGKLKEGIAGPSLEKAHGLLTEFNDTTSKIKALGLSVQNVGIKMGVPPEITARVVGTTEALDLAEIEKLAKENQENKLLGTVLEALRTAASFKEQLQGIGFKGLTVDMKLGLLPSVEVGLLQ